ncbi:hypothetical protein GCM10023319_40800 [Nocardia iowensis]
MAVSVRDRTVRCTFWKVFSTWRYTGLVDGRGIRELLRHAVRVVRSLLARFVSVGRTRPADPHRPGFGRTVPRPAYATTRQCVPARSSLVRRRQRGTGAA